MTGPMLGSSELGSGPSGSIKDRKFLDELNDSQLLKKDPGSS
jgi:hypothetical protein